MGGSGGSSGQLDWDKAYKQIAFKFLTGTGYKNSKEYGGLYATQGDEFAPIHMSKLMEDAMIANPYTPVDRSFRVPITVESGTAIDISSSYSGNVAHYDSGGPTINMYDDGSLNQSEGHYVDHIMEVHRREKLWGDSTHTTESRRITGYSFDSETNTGVFTLENAFVEFTETHHFNMNSPTFSTTVSIYTMGRERYIRLEATASTVDGEYEGCQIEIVDGDGEGQRRTITTYNGGEQIATVDRPWVSMPSDTSTYRITDEDQFIIPGNPNAIAYDPSGNVEAITGQLERLRGYVEDMSPKSDFEYMLETLKTKADENFAVLSVEEDVQDQINKSLADAKKMLADAAFDADTVDTFLSESVRQVTEELAPVMQSQPAVAEKLLRPIVESTFERMREYPGPVMVKALSEAKSALSDVYVEPVKTAVVMNKALDDVVERVTSRISLLPGKAIEVAVAAMDHSALDAMVASVEEKMRQKLNPQIQRYVAECARAGTLMSTARVRGVAMLHREHLRGVNEFRAQMEIKVFEEVLRNWLERHIQETLQEQQIRRQLVAEHLELTARQVAEQYRLYGALVLEQGSQIARDIAERYRFHTQSIHTILAQKAQAEDASSERYTQAVGGLRSHRLNSYMQNYLQDRQAQHSGIFQGQGAWVSLKQAELQGQMQLMYHTSEGNRLAMAAYIQEQEANLDIDSREMTFPLDIMEYGGRLLASMQGGVAHRGGRTPGKAGGIIGGALSGAAMGAMAFPDAAPLAAGIGGALGMAAAIFD